MTQEAADLLLHFADTTEDDCSILEQYDEDEVVSIGEIREFGQTHHQWIRQMKGFKSAKVYTREVMLFPQKISILF